MEGLEKFNILKSSKCFLFLSESESFGQSLLEAISCGIPAIAYDLQAYKEIYRNNEVFIVKKNDVKVFLEDNNCKYEYFEKDILAKKVATLITQQKIIGLFHGKMEFGPRALGNRSIIGNPCSSETQSIMNLKIKFRESFRPFAPSILEENIDQFFELPKGTRSPYMLLVAAIKEHLKKELTEEEKKLWGIAILKIKRSQIPAITHVDYSARIQTVSIKTNPFYYNIIKEFDSLTGFPIVVNTSFNVRGEPIVCSLQDAYQCFMRTNIDYLVLENYILNKTQQKQSESDTKWLEKIKLD